MMDLNLRDEIKYHAVANIQQLTDHSISWCLHFTLYHERISTFSFSHICIFECLTF